MLLFFSFAATLLPAIKIEFRYFMLSESNCHKIVIALLLTLVFPRVIRTRRNLGFYLSNSIAFTITIVIIIIIILKYTYNNISTNFRLLCFDEIYFHRGITIYHGRIHKLPVSIIVLLQLQYIIYLISNS